MRALIILPVIMSTMVGQVHAAQWGYGGSHGPDHWGKISATCSDGKNQSPINIDQTVPAKLDSLKINYTGHVTELMHNGHTLQGRIDGKNTLVIDGETFELKQFHFHTPSENLIQGKQYPLEAHFVHADQQGNLAVIAVMYEVGKKSQPLEKLAANLPVKGKTSRINQKFSVEAMLPDQYSYYRFNGSLTTPPCSEGVRWLVLKESKQINQAQSEQLQASMGNNNRPIQPANARVILTQ